MCVVDKFGMDRYLYGGECVDACPQAYFHTELKACEPCPSHCKVCSSATHCIKCEDSFYLNDAVCNALECGEGTAPVFVKLIEMLLLFTYPSRHDFSWPMDSAVYTCILFHLLSINEPTNQLINL